MLPLLLQNPQADKEMEAVIILYTNTKPIKKNDKIKLQLALLDKIAEEEEEEKVEMKIQEA